MNQRRKYHRLTRGERYGKLVAVERVGYSETSHSARWMFKCDCGNRKIVEARHAVSGAIKSCGCTRGRYSHGHAKEQSSEYLCWVNMIQRCYNPNNKGFSNYGGRGILVCERWKSFPNFIEDLGRKPSPRHSLDRINNNGNYEPGNCRWAERFTQARNRRSNVFITYNNITATVSEWAERNGLKAHTLHTRIKRGWPISRAISEPSQRSGT